MLLKMGRGAYVGSKLVWGAAFFLDVAFLFYNSLPLQIIIQNFKKILPLLKYRPEEEAGEPSSGPVLACYS